MQNSFPVILFLVVVSRTLQAAEEKPVDVTNASAKVFKSNLNHTVTIKGRLVNGKEGLCLWDATPKDVVFYIIQKRPSTGSYSYPESWMKYRGKPVRVTGKLYFHEFPKHEPVDETVQAGMDHYYVVLQESVIQPVTP